jgi:hypothetical protein
MFMLAANGVSNPLTWAEVGERIGVPAMILLLLLGMFCVAAWWAARHVVKPVVASHLQFVKQCGSALETLKAQEVAQTAAINELREDHRTTRETVEGICETVTEVHGQVRQVKGMLSRRDRGTESNGTVPVAS